MNYLLSRKRPESTRLIVERAINEARYRFRREDVEIVVKKADKSRTGQQNKYFWALCGLLETHTGQDKEVIKMQLMDACSFVFEVILNGRVVITPMSTTALNATEFGTLISATQSLCDAMGVIYPLPADMGHLWT